MYRILIVVSLLLILPVMASAACGGCRSDCGQSCKLDTCTRPACDTCNDCDTGCAQPCACTEWIQYCGCEMLTGLCISLEAACNAGTEGPIKLLLRDTDFNDIVTIELAGPIDGYYTAQYEFETPIRADNVQEAVIINDTEDSVTLTWFSVYGMFGDCGGWSYFDFSCPGIVIGPDGCPRMVLF